jgi:hypothetical protein
MAPEQQRAHRLTVRLTEAQRAKVEAAGGSEWVRSLIERAKLPGG